MQCGRLPPRQFRSFGAPAPIRWPFCLNHPGSLVIIVRGRGSDAVVTLFSASDLRPADARTEGLTLAKIDARVKRACSWIRPNGPPSLSISLILLVSAFLSLSFLFLSFSPSLSPPLFLSFSLCLSFSRVRMHAFVHVSHR